MVLRATTLETVGGHRCPACSRALADDMVCCPWDGTPVARGRCTRCDRQLDGEWRTCPFCRTPVEAREPDVTPTDDDQPADAPSS